MKLLHCSFALAAGLALSGCGKSGDVEPTSTVSGKVTLAGGVPLPGGTINFRSMTAVHRLGSGEIQADGTYVAKDVPQGECKVFIDNSYLKPAGKEAGGYTPPGETKQPPPGTKYVAIQPKYTTEAGTDLRTTVSGGTATYNVELK
jgi:hypothetical protein